MKSTANLQQRIRCEEHNRHHHHHHAASSLSTPSSPSLASRAAAAAVTADADEAIARGEFILESEIPDDKLEDVVAPQGWRSTSIRILLALASLSFLVFYVGDNVTIKSMDRQFLAPCHNCESRYFDSPFYQTWLIYLGELLCLVYYFGRIAWRKWRGVVSTDLSHTGLKAGTGKPQCPVMLWALDAFFDYSSICLETIATNFTRASTVTMLRNFNVAMTALFTLLYLRYGLRINHISGVLLLTTGLCLTGVDAMKDPDEETNYNNSWVGIVMALVGTTIAAFQFVWEEYLFRKYDTPPILGLGLIGLFGGIFATVMLGVAWATGLEDFGGSLYQMGTDNAAGNYLKASSVFYCFIPVLELLSAMFVVKLGSGLLRTIIQGLATVILWLVELAVGWGGFRVLSFVGLICIVIACLLYNYDQYEWKAEGEPSWSKTYKQPVLCLCLRDPDEARELLKGGKVEFEKRMNATPEL